MRWEELTSDRFPEAVQESGRVCLISLSVIERHGHHLPLGTDMYEGRGILDRVAAMEPVIVFPDYYFTQIPEARHQPGTIAIDGELMVKLLDNVCREIARNGMDKIVLVNAHGGNRGLLSLFPMLQLYHPQDYVLYVVDPIGKPMEGVTVPWEATENGHAGPGETSMMLALRPDLVHMERIVAGEGRALGRLKPLNEAGVVTGIWWYADQPHHYQGDGSKGNAETGEQILNNRAEYIVRAVRAIKADSEARRLQDEFFARSAAPSG